MLPTLKIAQVNYVRTYGWKRLAILFSAIASLCLSASIHAEEKVADKLRISVGGYTIPRLDSAVSLTEPNLGAGVSVSPEDTLGLKSEQVVLRLDGYYRFNAKHSLTFSWYSIRSDGSKVIEEEFTWVDENGNSIVIPVNARAQTQLDYDIFKLGYLWSFYHSNKVELAAGAGLHITKIAVGLSADTTIPANSSVKNVDTTVPLPVLSFGLTYNVTHKFHWYLKSEAFAITIADWEGVYTDSTLGLEYRFWRNVALGTGFGSNSLKVIEETGDYKFSYDNRISGVLLYVAAYF